MIFNHNLLFQSKKHLENFEKIIDSEFPNLYSTLCNGEYVDSSKISCYFILSSFVDGDTLVNYRTHVFNLINYLNLSESERNLMQIARELLERNFLTLSLIDELLDDNKMLVKTGFDIAYNDLSLSSDVLFELIATLRENQLEMDNYYVDNYFDR